MHGRLKIKTTAEQEEEKRKERAVKQKKYLAGLNAVFKKREEKVYDSEALLITAQLLMANPDALSLWNYRREVLLAFKMKFDEESWQKLLEDELKTIEYCLVKNPKSYGAWRHRGWVFETLSQPPYQDELDICDKYLLKDERNFHCWDHRRFIAERSGRNLREELLLTQNLIEKNFSNYSAWHYRSKLLPCVYPSSEGPHPIPDDIFLQELNRIVTAVFTDPSDQSPWFFLRWLLAAEEEQRERLLFIGVFPAADGATLVLVFTKEAACSDFSLFIDEELIPEERLKPFNNDKCIWVLDLPQQEEYNILVDGEGWKREQKKSILSLNKEYLPFRDYCLKRPLNRKSLSVKAKKTLEEIKDNFVMLDRIDHGNKWVLLSLVDILTMLQVPKYFDDIVGYLDHLEYVDPLRVNYYKDLRSKIIMEEKLRLWISRGYERETNAIDMSRQSLTRIVHPQYFSLVEHVNLSYNKLRNLEPLASLYNCVNLSLAGNPVEDLSPLQRLPRLKELNLDSCGIKSVDILKPLSTMVLVYLEMKENLLPTDNTEQLKDEISSLIPSLTKLYI